MKLSSESLLSHPNEKEETPKPIVRPALAPIKVDNDFLKATNRSRTTDKETIESRSFSMQYAHAYAVRLWATRPLLEEEVKNEWGHRGVVIKKIADLCQTSSGSHPVSSTAADAAGTSSKGKNSKDSPKKGKKRDSGDHEQHIAMREDIVVAVIGTVFKQQPEKPSILQELVEDNPMVPTQPKTRYISDKDVILLEDETTRVQLIPSEGCGLTINGIVNGIICAVKGKPTINGKFEVEDVIFGTPKPSIWPVSNPNGVEMIFVSGLHLASKTSNLANLDLLFDFLQGVGGCPAEHESSLKSKTRLFILGDAFGKLEPVDSKNKEKDKTGTGTTKTEIANKLDNILEQLARTMEVYILPGETDPAEPMFPQAPIHRCILPKSWRRKTFHSLGNPTRFQLPYGSEDSSLDVILSGGQNVKDAMKNTDIDSPVDMSQKLLQWGHLCPTAPDTMPLHPGIKDDIFVLKSLPNLFVVGNQKNFGIREWKNTKIITVPNFSESSTAVIFDKGMNILPLHIKLSVG